MGKASAKAALTMNGTQIEGRILVVSISDPNVRSRRKAETYGTRSAAREGFREGRGTSSSAQGASKPPLKPFVPRAAVAKTKQRARVAMVPTTASDTAMAVDAPTTKTEIKVSKTQDDFRRLLSGSK
jgi:hypothetical protein